MTGYTVHSGTTIKFSEGWDRVFQERAAKSAKSQKTEKSSKKTAASAPAKAKARAKRAVKKKR